MRGYSIFDHAQLGHIDERKSATPKAPSAPRVVRDKPRPVRGWSVKSRLGLGPTFHNPFTLQQEEGKREP